MLKAKLPTLISVTCLVSIVLYGLEGSTRSSQPTVQLTTNPPSRLLPFEAEADKPQFPMRLKLQAISSTGQPLKHAKIHLQILTPPKNPWLPTDFPLVEGTKLLEVEASAPTSKLEVQQMLPIRGTYQLLVNVTPTIANTFTPFQQTLELPVTEHWVKYRNATILLAILLVAGLGGGWIIGGQPETQPGEIVPQRVRLLLSGAAIAAIASLLFINISAELAQSHTHKHLRPLVLPAVRQSQGLELRLLGDTHATVGQPAHLVAEVVDAQTRQPVTDVNLKVKATQLEDHWITFAAQSPSDQTGKLAWQQQFFDGAPHKVAIEVSPQPDAIRQFKPFGVAQAIKVEGAAPPITIRLIVLGYFVDVVVLGVWLGLRLRGRLT